MFNLEKKEFYFDQKLLLFTKSFVRRIFQKILRQRQSLPLRIPFPFDGSSNRTLFKILTKIFCLINSVIHAKVTDLPVNLNGGYTN